MVELVCACFAILEYADQFIINNHESTKRVYAEQVLGIYSPKYSFTCEKFIEKGLIFAIKIVVTIFYNNKQKISSDEVRKNTVECLKKSKGPKKIHFKEKMLSSFYLRFYIFFYWYLFVCLKYFIILLSIFWETYLCIFEQFWYFSDKIYINWQ